MKGMIPDEWVKEQVQTEECGWYPLDEAIIHKTGRPYEVSLIWRGQSNRLKFFWPEMAMPSRSDMQKSVELFYPGGRLLAYYPAEDNDANPMVLVPPMTENYVVLDQTDWTYMTEEDVETYNMICEEEGEPIEAPIRMEDGSYEVVVLEYDTNEHKTITFGEGAAWTKKSGKSESGGLNEKGRKSYERENPGSDLKAPSKKKGNKRRASFCARMTGMRKRQKPSNNTGDDRLSKSLRAWNC